MAILKVETIFLSSSDLHSHFSINILYIINKFEKME